MQVAFFLVKTLGYLYIWVLILRIMLQWVRADYRNPISQFVVRTTNPLVVPLRRVVPPVRGFDTASFVALFLVQFLLCIVLIYMATQTVPGFWQLAYVTALRLIYATLRLYMFVLIVWVIMSWVAAGQYNPVSAVFARLAEPLLAPVRRVIPAIGGLDLSALFVIIGLQALMLLIRVPSGYELVFWGGTWI